MQKITNSGMLWTSGTCLLVSRCFRRPVCICFLDQQKKKKNVYVACSSVKITPCKDSIKVYRKAPVRTTPSLTNCIPTYAHNPVSLKFDPHICTQICLSETLFLHMRTTLSLRNFIPTYYAKKTVS